MNRIRFDEFELEIGFMATCEGVVVDERDTRCFYMAVQSFSCDIVRKAIWTSLGEAGAVGDLVTPRRLKWTALGIHLFENACSAFDDDVEGAA